jgi:Mg-chelatase subunit ChlI
MRSCAKAASRVIHGERGTGKSVVMRVLAEKLERLTDLTVVIRRSTPPASIASCAIGLKPLCLAAK